MFLVLIFIIVCALLFLFNKSFVVIYTVLSLATVGGLFNYLSTGNGYALIPMYLLTCYILYRTFTTDDTDE